MDIELIEDDSDELEVGDDELKKEVKRLREIALEELPGYITEENEARAWVARRVLEICERERKTKQTIQALLIMWMFNGKFGQIWMDHPDHPATFREFLHSVGSDAENNKLSLPVISNMVAIAESILPFCKDHNIPVDGYITTALWTKFQEAIPALRAASESNDEDAVNSILEDVRTLSNRDVVRAKYRKPRSERLAVSDIIYGNGTTVVVTVVPTSELSLVKAAISRVSSWEAIAAGNVNGKTASIKVSLTE